MQRHDVDSPGRLARLEPVMNSNASDNSDALLSSTVDSTRYTTPNLGTNQTIFFSSELRSTDDNILHNLQSNPDLTPPYQSSVSFKRNGSPETQHLMSDVQHEGPEFGVDILSTPSTEVVEESNNTTSGDTTTSAIPIATPSVSPVITADSIPQSTTTEEVSSPPPQARTSRRSSSDPLSSQFPSLRVWTGTWNMGAKEFPKPMESEIRVFIPSGYDIYALAIQEGVSNAFVDAVEMHLRAFSVVRLPVLPQVHGRGDGSFIFAKHTGLAVFCKLHLLPAVQIVAQAEVALGLTEGSKGAAAIVLHVSGTTLAFISCHLPANSLQGRRDAYKSLSQSLAAELGDPHFMLTAQFHHIVWMGDVNYRLYAVTLEQVMDLIEHHAGEALHSTQSANSLHTPHTTAVEEKSDQNSLLSTGTGTVPDAHAVDRPSGVKRGLERLRDYDELRRDQREGHAFMGFQEAQMMHDFYPTYKRKEGRESPVWTDPASVQAQYRTIYKEPWYKSGRISHRIPAWTDRILYHSHPDLKQYFHPEALFALPTAPETPISGPTVSQPSKYIHNYTCVNDYLTLSDHAPVFCTFVLKLPHLAIGFEFRRISMEAARKMAALETELNETRNVSSSSQEVVTSSEPSGDRIPNPALISGNSTSTTSADESHVVSLLSQRIGPDGRVIRDMSEPSETKSEKLAQTPLMLSISKPSHSGDRPRGDSTQIVRPVSQTAAEVVFLVRISSLFVIRSRYVYPKTSPNSARGSEVQPEIKESAFGPYFAQVMFPGPYEHHPPLQPMPKQSFLQDDEGEDLVYMHRGFKLRAEIEDAEERRKKREADEDETHNFHMDLAVAGVHPDMTLTFMQNATRPDVAYSNSSYYLRNNERSDDVEDNDLWPIPHGSELLCKSRKVNLDLSKDILLSFKCHHPSFVPFLHLLLDVEPFEDVSAQCSIQIHRAAFFGKGFQHFKFVETLYRDGAPMLDPSSGLPLRVWVSLECFAVAPEHFHQVRRALEQHPTEQQRFFRQQEQKLYMQMQRNMQLNTQ